MLLSKRQRESTSERPKECARGKLQVRDGKACKRGRKLQESKARKNERGKSMRKMGEERVGEAHERDQETM